jgi:putative inorganic carbon (hco3(-)) transporter
MGTGLIAYPDRLSRLDRRWITAALWLGMALSLALCYLGTIWPITLAGLLLFGVLAALRPDLALLFVPLTAPLFLTPIVLPSQQQLELPPHELALLATAAVALPEILLSKIRSWKPTKCVTSGICEVVASSPPTHQANYIRPLCRVILLVKLLAYQSHAVACNLRFTLGRVYRAASRSAPESLLLVAGVAGVLMAVPEPEARRDALRAFRWFVAEPLIFVALIRSRTFWRQAAPQTDSLTHASRMIHAFVIGGAAVALVGLTQFAIYLLHAHSEPASFAAGAGALGGMRRITSVYGNPNNLALYLGRVWPLAAALAMVDQGRRTNDQRWRHLVFGLSSLVCLVGLLLSLSRGAWLGAAAALIILIMPAAQRRFGRRLLPGGLIAGSIIAAVIVVIFALRGGLLGGSSNVRILFWEESLKLLERRPQGLGLDQFFYYHHPAYGRSQIDPGLANTQERYARQPHNLLFELWLNLGPLGVVAFGWLLARWLAHARAALRSSPSGAAAAITHGAIAAMAAALVHGLVDSFYFWPDIAIALWLLVGVGELIRAERRQ